MSSYEDQSGPLEQGAEWLKTGGRDGDVVMSSRVRLARNIAGFPFPSRARETERRDILALLKDKLLGSDVDDHLLWVDMLETPELERNVLVERHLISKQLAKGDSPRAVAISAPDEWLAVMVNEEDHLRIQVIRNGFAVDEALQRIDQVDTRLENLVDFAFSPRFGYLTACPTNVGAGIRVSVMLHLPALKLNGEIDKVRRAAKAMNIAVRGFYGEGSDAVGDIYQLSNQTTLGRSEEDIAHELSRRVLPGIIEYERRARANLLERRRMMLEDSVHRALGVVRHARLINSSEALQCLSFVRLGIQLGVIEGVDPLKVNQLLLLTQPAHLQQLAGRTMDQNERRVERARLMRRFLGEA